MDPKQAVNPEARVRLPRARGAVARRGSPAHAGMDPARPPRRARPWRLPRARGDGPKSPAGLLSRQSAPPRMRGCTPTDSFLRVVPPEPGPGDAGRHVKKMLFPDA